MASFKSLALRDSLAADLSKRLPALAQTKGFASDLPTLLLGSGAAASQSAFVRIQPEASLYNDIAGNAQPVYSPHVIQVCVEESATADISLFLGANFMHLLAACAKMGCKVELYMSANTDPVAVGELVPANFKAVWNNSVDSGIMGNV
jgi:hypothetical protein